MIRAGIASFLALAGTLLPIAIASAEMPGKSYHIDPASLPKPYATASAVNPSRYNPSPSDARINLPIGFQINLFADQLQHARNIKVASDGTVFMAQSRRGRILLLKDSDGDSQADIREFYVRGMSRPHGLAIHDSWLYFADTDHIWRIDWVPGRTRPKRAPEKITAEGALGDGSGHWTRNIAISPDGKTMFASIGSRGNIGEEPLPRASIQKFSLTKNGFLTDQETYATGLRNPVGIGFNPANGRLYTVVNERDGLGDGLVPDYFTSVRAGGFYGWPYAYIGPNPQPDYGERAPDMVAKSIIPDVLIQSHSAPLGFTFLQNADVPEDWKDDALVALHGSWNAARPTGYKIIRVPFEKGKPTGGYVNFMTGFHLNPEAEDGAASIWGRPVALAVMPDGSILFSEDAGQKIWRISRL
ncbi:PQQ-dependent sugar dehydrogenase [Aestuariispira insulae]|uniref:Glucose/arabinose dehydrogenase n=1 Tax=Aestuariispira insulae TaxID=1461337 RepID=A0A3D9HF82_9PROT|nr:PQQ-dependent sugar dehydrogenase [Aestuariispira insulae]RED48138.1 glucose/arabinose dehydrogenase [Aestuariispira insulae]